MAVFGESAFDAASADADAALDDVMAATPALSPPELSAVKEVKIIVAYNMDDEARGIEAYERLIKSFGKTVNSSAKLLFERWNLTVLTDKVREKLHRQPCSAAGKVFSHVFLPLLADGRFFSWLRSVA